MKIPPIHNMVVQWYKGQSIFFNIFTNCPTSINLTEASLEIPHSLSYDSYYTHMLKQKPNLYIPVKASTIDELKLEHPELFL